MKIIHILMGRCNPESSNGIDKTVFYLSSHQAKIKNEVTIINITEKEAISISNVNTISLSPRFHISKKIKIHLLNRFYDLIIARSFINMPKNIKKTIIDLKPDIVHFHFIHIPQFIKIAKFLRYNKIPYCVTVHGGLSNMGLKRNEFFKKAFGKLFELTYLNKAAFIHYISKEDYDGGKNYNIKNLNYVIIPNGIDLDQNLVVKIDNPLASKYDFESKFIFTFLGRLDPAQKGLDLLLESFSKFNHENSILIIVGPDWRNNLKNLKAIVKRSKSENRIIFWGAAYGETKKQILNMTNIFVHISRWEAGVPFSVLEAAAAGKPLLLSEYADPNGIFEKNGACFKSELNSDSIARTLLNILNTNKIDLESMGANSLKTVKINFDWHTISEKILEAYNKYK